MSSVETYLESIFSKLVLDWLFWVAIGVIVSLNSSGQNVIGVIVCRVIFINCVKTWCTST